ncbi:MAG: hypothetical protein ABIM89_13930 [Mycobacteriales bacterium]
MKRAPNLIALLALVACGACGPATSRTGTEMDPVTLTVAQHEPVLEELARATRKSPVTVTAKKVPGLSDVEGALLAALAAGEIDLASIRSGRLFGEGAASLAPLSAPFLVTNDDQAKAIARDGVAQDLMASLSDLDLVGLALVPQGLRHPFGFGQRPLVATADYLGQLVSTPPDKGSTDILTALGARVDHSIDAARTRLVHSGELRGIEVHLGNFGIVDRPAVVTANVTLYDRFDVVVVRRPSWEALTTRQQAALRSAVSGAQDTEIGLSPREATSFAGWCQEEGASSVNASAEQLAELHGVLDPITQAMASDPELTGSVARMRELGNGTDGPGGLECDATEPTSAGSESAGPVAARGDQSALDGVLRFAVDERELLDGGASASDAKGNSGVWQMQVQQGAAEVTPPGGPPGFWTFTFDGRRVALDFGTDGGTLVGTYALDGDNVRFGWNVPAGDPNPWIGKVLFAKAVRLKG